MLLRHEEAGKARGQRRGLRAHASTVTLVAIAALTGGVLTFARSQGPDTSGEAAPRGPAAAVAVGRGPNLLGVDGRFGFGLGDRQIVTLHTGRWIAGWRVERGSVDVLGSDWQAPAGHAVDLSGDRPGTLGRDVRTRAGAAYVVAFSLAANPQCGPPSKAMDVLWDGSAVARFGANGSGRSAAALGWHRVELRVVATGARTQLGLQSVTSGLCGPVVAAVTLRAA